VARLYTAELVDLPGSGGALTIVSLPPRPDDEARWQLRGPDDDPGLFDRASRALSFHNVVELRDPGALVAAILATRPDDSYFRERVDAATILGREPTATSVFEDAAAIGRYDEPLARFAARVAVEPLAPVEFSPLSGMSLADLTKYSGYAGGAGLGYLGVFVDPMLLISVPAGIIILGASKGVARALEHGLYERLVRWITGTSAAALPRGTAEAEADQPSAADEGDHAHETDEPDES
jgi:hypothetical protein